MAFEPTRHRLVPGFLLARFADETGRILAERRDRSRRLTLPASSAGVEAGSYTVAAARPRARELDRLLAEIEARAADAVARLVSGPFPPAPADRAALALFFAVQLLLGPGHRAAVAQMAAALGEMIGAALEQIEEAAADDDEATPGEPPADAEADVLVHDGETLPVSLASLPRLARALSDRTWQLLRFPSRSLLTSDTPVVVWSRPGTAKPYQVGPATADEIRVALDPRHALVLARHAPAGEVVRDLGERHARALNRTVAEAARTWMYYHPESDPLERVELSPP
jgi:hypothetical protein